MKVRDLMTKNVLRIHPEEPVEVAARTLAQYNIGSLPVCGRDGTVFGMVTDRDLVVRCMASGKSPRTTAVQEIMTRGVVWVEPDMEAATAAGLMGRNQVRRLPVVERGRLCGMVSLGDLALREENALDAADALAEIAGNVLSD